MWTDGYGQSMSDISTIDGLPFVTMEQLSLSLMETSAQGDLLHQRQHFVGHGGRAQHYLEYGSPGLQQYA